MAQHTGPSPCFLIKPQYVPEFGDLTLTLNSKDGQETLARLTSQCLIQRWAYNLRAPQVFSSVQFSCLVTSDSLQPHGLQHTRLLVNHQFSQLAQTHVHRVIDAIQPSHPLSFSSFPAFNLFQHQGLFQRVGSSHQMDKVSEFQLQHQSFQ